MPARPRSTVSRALRAGALAAVLCAAASVFGSCSVLVDPESLVVKCEASPGLADADPCIEAGMHCVGGTCQPCEGAHEDCNGVDDDCDGTIDEGHDQDGDHYTWCGGGVAELADCVPTDPTIHPSTTFADPTGGSPQSIAIELCDGKDNDCDGSVDESPECEQSQSCLEVGCVQGRYCDTKSGLCLTPLPVGSGCASDSDCEAGFCVNPSEFQITTGDAAAKLCASACCSDKDCANGTVCELTRAGARACLPSNVVGRGDAKVGDACRDASECASGVCAARTCRARCRRNTDCSEGSDTCVLTATDGGPDYGWVCGDAAGHGADRGFCTLFDPVACRSGLCEDSECRAACGRDADCMSGERCGYTEFTGVVPPSTALVSRCVASTSVADTACCTNTDCTSPALCKPKSMGSRVAMVCQ